MMLLTKRRRREVSASRATAQQDSGTPGADTHSAPFRSHTARSTQPHTAHTRHQGSQLMLHAHTRKRSGAAAGGVMAAAYSCSSSDTVRNTSAGCGQTNNDLTAQRAPNVVLKDVALPERVPEQVADNNHNWQRGLQEERAEDFAKQLMADASPWALRPDDPNLLRNMYARFLTSLENLHASSTVEKDRYYSREILE